ncbi:MAG: polysaccharide deacetylase family protein [Erysipelotrichaceae bacterium]|nr:polysaccharide deacetylase family protein [Erysipelotrichaceae bacterium]
MRKYVCIVLVVAFLILSGINGLSLRKEKEERQALQIQEENRQREQQTQQIVSHYDDVVVTTDNTALYVLQHGEYKEAGYVAAGISFEISPFPVTYETTHFYIPKWDVYVPYDKVSPLQEEIIKDTRYKRYIPFNTSFTLNRTTLYTLDGELKYDLPSENEFAVIVKEDEYYGVEFEDELLWVKKSDVTETYTKKNATKSKATGIRVLAYHKFYDPKEETCTKIICHPLSQIKEHFQYLKEENYFTMNMQETLWYITKKANMPKKSVVITLDDGGKNTKLVVKMLEKYDLHATLFLIGSIYKSYMDSDNLELQSHTYNLHEYGKCSISPRGSAFLCSSDSKVLKDLEKSRELTNAFAFAYPYYEYNEKAIKLLKKAGFLLAFEDEHGLVKPGDDPFLISRYTLSNNSTLAELKYVLHH